MELWVLCESVNIDNFVLMIFYRYVSHYFKLSQAHANEVVLKVNIDRHTYSFTPVLKSYLTRHTESKERERGGG